MIKIQCNRDFEGKTDIYTLKHRSRDVALRLYLPNYDIMDKDILEQCLDSEFKKLFKAVCAEMVEEWKAEKAVMLSRFADEPPF